VSETSYRAARTASERLLCEIFSELTGVSQVGIDDNFFAIGGHSLLAMRLVARVRQRSAGALALRTLFECPTPAQLAPFIDALQADQEPDLLPDLGHLGDGRVVLSYGQRRLWTLDRLEGASATYNMPMAMRIRGALNAAALEQALLLLVERHEPLRTIMVEGEDGVPYGILLSTPELGAFMVQEKLADAEPLRARIERESALPFNLGRDLSLRATLLHCGADDAVLMLTVHHQAGDGISLGVMMDELGQAYAALIQGNVPQWKELAVQYSDWAAWQQTVLSNTLEQKVNRAKQRLAGMPESLSLPLDYPRNANRTRKAGYVPIELSADVTQRLESIAREQKTTLFTVVLATYAALLARLSGQSEIVVGSPVSGRNRVESERLVGFMVNTLALPLTMDRTNSMIDLVELARTAVEQALIDQDVPFEKLVEELNVPRSLAHTPVFQTMLAFQTEQTSHVQLSGLTCSPEHVELPNAKFDLMLFLHIEQGKLVGAMEYDTDLFAAARVEVWARAYEFLSRELSVSPDKPVISRPLQDQRHISLSGPKAVSEYLRPDHVSLHTLFEDEVAKTPDNLALVFEDQQLTYAELDKRANQLGRKLIQLGVAPGSIVAVALPRSLDLIVAVLAILKTGAGYVPLDPEYPINRLHYMIADSAASVMLSTSAVTARLNEQAKEVDLVLQWPTLLCLDTQSVVHELIRLDSHQIIASERLGVESPEHLAYVIYTSGSTGTPKGIEMRAGALVNLLCWQKRSSSESSQRGAVLQFTSISFDVSFQEIFTALSGGHTLVLLRAEDRLNAQTVLDTIKRHDVTDLYAPQSVIQFLISEALRTDALPLRHIYQAGEALKITPEIKQFFKQNPEVTLHNHYGPAETHVVTSWCATSDVIEKEREPSIGSQIDGTHIYILDSALAQVPVGVPGELYITGECLARGYLNKPGMTAERFVADPFGEAGQRMYRSGDLASWNFDGSIAYHGRADQQVKIRGFRIELGEIESTLAKALAFEQVVVVPWGKGSDVKLVAYVVRDANTPMPATGVIRAIISKQLPDYMVPSAYVPVASIPVTQNGKLDRSALPEPRFESALELYRPPVSAHEKLICELFAELTQSSRVGLDDSFFELGGHSLLAMRLITRIRVETGLEVSLRTLFENPIAEHLALQLAQAKKSSKPKLVRGMGKKV
jgi:amino acid adenylation domain-containing protein